MGSRRRVASAAALLILLAVGTALLLVAVAMALLLPAAVTAVPRPAAATASRIPVQLVAMALLLPAAATALPRLAALLPAAATAVPRPAATDLLLEAVTGSRAAAVAMARRSPVQQAATVACPAAEHPWCKPALAVVLSAKPATP
jgi:hypothetical protein